MFKLLRIFKAVKLLMKNPLFAELLEQLQVHEWILKMLTFFGFVFFGVHIMACIWYLGSTFNDLTSDSWLIKYKMYIFDENGLQVKVASDITVYILCV